MLRNRTKPFRLFGTIPLPSFNRKGRCSRDLCLANLVPGARRSRLDAPETLTNVAIAERAGGHETARDCRAPVHVAQFVDSLDPGGAEELVLSLSARLIGRGIAVTVMHFGNPWIRERAKRDGIPQVTLPGHGAYKSKYTLPLFVRRLRALLGERRIDVLHSHLLGATFSGAMAARLAHIPSVGTLHDAYSLTESRLAPYMLRLAAFAGSCLVAVSDDIRRTAAGGSKALADNVELIYNGVALTRFAASAGGRGPESPVTLTVVARFVPVKRLDVLLDAVSRIRSDRNWRLQIVGDGPEQERLAAMSRQLGVAGRVHFLGFRSDVPAVLAASDVFVLSSDSEGLSVSLLESMAAGLPAVATDVGGNRELITDGHTGYLVPPGDPDALASKLEALIEDASKRRAMGGAARRRAERLFDANAMVDRYLNLYRSLLRTS